jgi:uncharacterized protein
MAAEMRPSLALVTGASSGIGLEMSKVLAKDHCDLILVARDKKKLEQVAAEIRKSHAVDVTVISQDLALPNGPSELVKKVTELGKPVDILINNAGYGDFGPFAEAAEDRILGMIQVNIIALTRLTRAFLPSMIKRGNGKVLNVASTAAFQPGPLMAVYYASKAFVLSFSEAIANELSGTGVTVTALCPGPTESGFQQAAKMEGSKLLSSKMVTMMTSVNVAEQGIDAMKKGRRIIVTGLANKMMAFSVRLAPRGMLTQLVRKMQERA